MKCLIFLSATVALTFAQSDNFINLLPTEAALQVAFENLGPLDESLENFDNISSQKPSSEESSSNSSYLEQSDEETSSPSNIISKEPAPSAEISSTPSKELIPVRENEISEGSTVSEPSSLVTSEEIGPINTYPSESDQLSAVLKNSIPEESSTTQSDILTLPPENKISELPAIIEQSSLGPDKTILTPSEESSAASENNILEEASAEPLTSNDEISEGPTSSEETSSLSENVIEETSKDSQLPSEELPASEIIISKVPSLSEESSITPQNNNIEELALSEKQSPEAKIVATSEEPSRNQEVLVSSEEPSLASSITTVNESIPSKASSPEVQEPASSEEPSIAFQNTIIEELTALTREEPAKITGIDALLERQTKLSEETTQSPTLASSSPPSTLALNSDSPTPSTSAPTITTTSQSPIQTLSTNTNAPLISFSPRIESLTATLTPSTSPPIPSTSPQPAPTPSIILPTSVATSPLFKLISPPKPIETQKIVQEPIKPKITVQTPRPQTYTPIINSFSTNTRDSNAKTVHYESWINPDNSYSYAVETDNGIAADAEGVLTSFSGDPLLQGNVVNGGFSWFAPDGQKIAIRYVADENGYHPVGDAIPTSPPIPPLILRSLRYLKQFYPDIQI